jgi:hypothetical protein
MNKQNTEAAKEYFAKAAAAQARRAAERPVIQAEGEAALRRLFDVAQGDTGQSGVVARFLLSCYNGECFPFDLTEFRSLDFELFDDCIAVLKMDASPQREVHTYFPEGGEKFQKLRRVWRVRSIVDERAELVAYRERYGVLV